MGYLALLKGLWTQSKWVVILSVFAFSHYVAFTAGQKNILRENAREQSKQVQAERKKGVDAVKKASSDTERLKDLEKQNEKKVEELDKIPDRVKCPISPDELRILREIKSTTTR